MYTFSYLLILAVFSVAGNVFVIASLLCNKRTRTMFDSFIIQICLMDFLVGAFLKSSFIVEDYLEGHQIDETHCYFMTTFMTASPAFVLMILLILLFYAIFSSYKRVRIEKFLTLETTFITNFILWFLIFGAHLIYHNIFGSSGSGCAVEDSLLTASVYSNTSLMAIIIVQLVTLFGMEMVRKARDAINMRQPEAVYNNLSIEVNNNLITTDGLDKPLRNLLYAQSILFLVFWMPFYVIRLMYIIEDKKHSLEMIILQLYAYLIGYFKSIVAPFLTLIVYPDSRYLLHKIRELDCGKSKLKKVFSNN